jgi:hypothetical protein
LISLVYNLFRSFIRSTHISPNLLSAQLPATVIAALFRGFGSPDVRERQTVKQALSEIMARLPDRTPFIVSLISTCLIDAFAGEPICVGLAEIFELFTAIIQSIPVFSGHSFECIIFRQLLPLHLRSEYRLFSGPIVSSMLLLLEREPRSVDKCLMFLWNHFPCASQMKQILFIDEIQSIVQRFWQTMSPLSARRLFERLSSLFSSVSAELSEKSLALVCSDGFRQLLKQYYPTIAPMLIVRAVKISRGHWNTFSVLMAVSLAQELAALDPLSFAKLRLEAVDEETCVRKETWATITGVKVPPAAATARTATLKILPVRGAVSRPVASGRRHKWINVATENTIL